MATTRFSSIIGSSQVVPFFEDWATVTCTSSWTTNTVLTSKRMILGPNAYYDVNVALSGAPNSADLTIILPTGDVISSASMATPANIATVIQGSVNINDVGVRAYVGDVLYSNTAQVLVGHGAGAGNIGVTNQANPITFGIGDTVSVKFMVPLVRLLGGMVAQGAGLATSVKPGLVANSIPPTNLISTDLTSQSGLTIDPSDVVLCKYAVTNNRATLDVVLNTVTVTAAAVTLSFTLPAAVPRPLVSTVGTIAIYDNSASSYTIGQFVMNTTGIVQINKAAGVAFTGGTNSSFFQGQLSWFIA